ncbi:MAG TPA: flagellar basal-body rod protein FlgF [Solirubrobacteraceae bacterium]|nr:flagellar basal-body rod protein FlgF [Solirubrobacteraceae bacterium]
MLQGLYAAASGMEAQQNQFDALSNDLANLNTPGYQATEVGFQDLLYSTAGPAASGTNVPTGTGAAAWIVGRSQAQGSLQNTGDPFDVAIQGEGFLQVRRPDGSTALTRNGSLEVNASGELTDQMGNPVLGAGGQPIRLPQGFDSREMKILPDGEVLAGTQSVGRIQIVSVPAPDQLVPDGDSLFSVTAGSGAARPVAGSTLQQGMLEGSNVDVGAVMSELVASERTYQLSSQAVQYQDQMLQIADQLRK